MDVRIYDPPAIGSPVFRAVGRPTASTTVTTVERLHRPGYFTVEIPLEARHAAKLTEGGLVLIEGSFWGIVDDVKLSCSTGGAQRVVSGRQLNGLTDDRITIPPGITAVTGAQGYDTATGTTEAVMKHFVSSNMCNLAQPNRIVYGLEIAADQGRGTVSDKYMSRHEVLSDVLDALGEAAGLGNCFIECFRGFRCL